MQSYKKQSSLTNVIAVLAGIAVLTVVAVAGAKNANFNQATAQDSSESRPIASMYYYGSSTGYARFAVDYSKPNNDIALLIKVKTALVSEPRLKRFALEVGVLSGVVTLYGEVDTFAQLAMAERIAYGVQGVEAVKSGVAVAGPA